MFPFIFMSIEFLFYRVNSISPYIEKFFLKIKYAKKGCILYSKFRSLFLLSQNYMDNYVGYTFFNNVVVRKRKEKTHLQTYKNAARGECCLLLLLLLFLKSEKLREELLMVIEC